MNKELKSFRFILEVIIEAEAYDIWDIKKTFKEPNIFIQANSIDILFITETLLNSNI